MANNKEHVKEKYVTGKGELVGFISIIKPSTKYDSKGKDGYVAHILLDNEEGEKLTAKLKEVRTQQYKQYGKGTSAAELPCTPYGIKDKETGEITPDPQGRYIFKTKASAFIENGKPRFKPNVFNAKRQPVKDVSIGEGTVARLSVILSGYSVAGKTGVSAKLVGVQIIKLIEYAGGCTGDEFDIEEDGFDGVGDDFTEEETTVPADEEDDEEEEF